MKSLPLYKAACTKKGSPRGAFCISYCKRLLHRSRKRMLRWYFVTLLFCNFFYPFAESFFEDGVSAEECAGAAETSLGATISGISKPADLKTS